MAPRTRQTASTRPTLVIGIDFGTTFSGVAWSSTSKPNQDAQIQLVSGWNSRYYYGDADREKVPSIITYEDNSPSDWGYNVPPGAENDIRWFKLLLLDEKDIPAHLLRSGHLSHARTALQRHNRHAAEVVGDYLRLLWEHSIQDIERAIGKRVLNSSLLKVVVTLPAIWPAYAQSRMREAVSMAGLLDPREAGETDLKFISEPEAAALATLDDISDRTDLAKNDHFVLCDAGGGTVDVIAYKMQKMSPITLQESVRGTGNLYGAVALDDEFRARLQAKLPKRVLDSLGKGGVQFTCHKEWEQGIKLQFTKNDGRQWMVRPTSAREAADNQFLGVKFDPQEVWNIYKPILAENVELLLRQIRQIKELYNTAPKYVVLVGGFGKSRVLYDYVSEKVSEETPTTEILQSRGERPWTAICRGAVMEGLGKIKSSSFTSPLVETRIARYSVGTIYNDLPWDAERHEPGDREWCPVQQEFLAADQLKWFLEVGHPICAEEAGSAVFFQSLERADETITTDLVYSESSTTPKRNDSSVKKLCQVNWKHVPKFEDLPSWTNRQGKKYREVYYEIRMVIESGCVDFQVFYQDKMVASRNVSVDFEGSGDAVRQRS